MSKILTQSTKDKIQKVLDDLTEYYLEELPSSQKEKKYSYCQRLALEKIEDNFLELEFRYEFLSDFYDEDGNILNLEEVKKLSCEYLNELI